MTPEEQKRLESIEHDNPELRPCDIDWLISLARKQAEEIALVKAHGEHWRMLNMEAFGKLAAAEAENRNWKSLHETNESCIVNQQAELASIRSLEAENAKLVEGLKRISGPCEYGWPDNEQNCRPQCNRCIARALLAAGTEGM